MITVILDIYGGDYSPEETLKGALLALQQDKDLFLLLSGDRPTIETFFSDKPEKNRIEILEANSVITNDDSPTEAVVRKKDSSLVVALNCLKTREDCQGFVSTGSSGAVLTASILLEKRIKGIHRPALAPVLPTVIQDKKVILVDCGVNPEPQVNNLLQYAQMGIAYSKANGVINPVVGLLNNGVEAKKGNSLTKEAYKVLSESGLNFYGNIEGRDILLGIVDVVVCDGFSGNIALKACEGTALSMFSLIKENIMKGGIRAKFGYLLLKPALKNVKKTMDYNDYGGAVLLGMEKIIVKSHGSSKAKAVCNSVLQVKTLIEKKVTEKIALEISNE